MTLYLATLLISLLGVTCSGLGDSLDNEWWETTLVYDISPSAYQDSDGDGHGDLQGIISRLEYIHDLGVETILLNSIYPSPVINSGNDVSDYKNIHPLIGNLSDFDDLLEEAHGRDMKVILDIVPNHSSDQHEWFNASIYKMAPYSDYYVWDDGTLTENGTRVPPDNWTTITLHDDDSAWTWNDERDQWYYHKFDETQPDLELRNENVRQEIMLILEFWLDRGVDGFRISGIPYFFEDPDIGTEENVEFLYEIRSFVDAWTKLTNSSSKLLVAGTCDTEVNSLSYYGRDNISGILPLNCRFNIDIDFTGNNNASEIAAMIEEWLNLIPANATTNWALWNENESRIASRIGSDRLDGLHMLSMLLPGQAFTHYGDEIGMHDMPIFSNEIDDEFRTRNGYDEISSENYSAIAPMQWDDTNAGGFSTSESTYFPVNDDYLVTNVEEQLENPKSHLNVYKNLVKLRKDPVFVRGDWELESLNDDAVLVLRRTLTGYPVYVVVINLSDDEQRVNMTELYPDLYNYLDVVVTSSDDDTNRSVVARDAIDLSSYDGLVLRECDMDDNTTEPFIDIDSSIEKSTIIDYNYKETQTHDNNDEEYNTTEEIEITTNKLDEKNISMDLSIPASTTEVSSAPPSAPIPTINPSPTAPSSSAFSETIRAKLQLHVIVGFSIAIIIFTGEW